MLCTLFHAPWAARVLDTAHFVFLEECLNKLLYNRINFKCIFSVPGTTKLPAFWKQCLQRRDLLYVVCFQIPVAL